MIRADRGPNGASEAVRVDRKIYGTSIADWRPRDYWPPSSRFLTFLGALHPGVLRWPAGHRSQEYVWSRGGPGQTGDWVLTPDHVDAFMAVARTVGADVLIGLNVKRGTPAAAADLVHYLNVEKGYGVKWAQIGNEPDLTDGVTPSPEVYAEQLVTFANAIRAVDPAIGIIGPEMLTGANTAGMQGRVDWMTPAVARAGSLLAGISWHYYPLDSGQRSNTSSARMSVVHLFQETAPDWRPAGLSFVSEIMPSLEALRRKHAPQAKVWITEFAEDPGPDAGLGISDTVAGAIWVADAFGRYASYGPGAILRWLYKSEAQHAYALLDGNEEPRPAYGAYWLYARHFGDRIVDAKTSSLTDVSVSASLRDDGRLVLVVANKKDVARRVRVSIDAFCANAAEELTLEGAGASSKSFRINGQALTLSNVMTQSPSPVDSSRLFDVELPPMSVRMIAYRP